MAKTEFLGLNLTEDDPLFEDWRKSLDGNNPEGRESNMQIIDKAMKDLSEHGEAGAIVVSSDSSLDEILAAIKSAENGAVFMFKFPSGQITPFNVEVDRDGNNVLIGRTSYTYWFADNFSYITIDFEYIIEYDIENEHAYPMNCVNWGNGFIVVTPDTLEDLDELMWGNNLPVEFFDTTSFGSFTEGDFPVNSMYLLGDNSLVKSAGLNEALCPYFEDVSHNIRTDILFNGDTQSYEFVENILVNLSKDESGTIIKPQTYPLTMAEDAFLTIRDGETGEYICDITGYDGFSWKEYRLKLGETVNLVKFFSAGSLATSSAGIFAGIYEGNRLNEIYREYGCVIELIGPMVITGEQFPE